jgi:hypothetical protein
VKQRYVYKVGYRGNKKERKKVKNLWSKQTTAGAHMEVTKTRQ